ncbi:acidic amino acid decarboxylase GADL1-like [Mercenaria mercenaria]|uniref:acidic amino acid decarboxylase GADL1-like n=1 Tax=Mercenaria mercenaria TaxID=6596 RepID=UPI00234F45F0|nr:acidic amino acid decarboxylase GADL1-like [Mercenaria mercenaria]
MTSMNRISISKENALTNGTENEVTNNVEGGVTDDGENAVTSGENRDANAEENGVTNCEENGVTNGVLKKHQHDTNRFAADSTAKKVINDTAANRSLSQNVATIPGKTDLEFLRNVVDIVNKGEDVKRVCDFHQPENLKTMSKDLKIIEDSASEDRLLDMCKDVIQYSVTTSNPRFFNQLYGGMDQYTLGGAWVTEALNPSQYTYEVSPVFTLMEEEVYKKMLHYIGFDGGGSMGNLYGMNVARYAKFPEIKTKGLYAIQKPLCVLTSDKENRTIVKSQSFNRSFFITIKLQKKGS